MDLLLYLLLDNNFCYIYIYCTDDQIISIFILYIYRMNQKVELKNWKFISKS